MHRPLIPERWIPAALVVLLAVGCGQDPVQPRELKPGDVTAVVGIPGFLGFNGDEKPAAETGLYYPIDIALDPEGRLIVDDWNNYRIRRVDFDGRVRTIVGTGSEPEPRENVIVDGGHPLETALHHAFSMAYDAAGDMFLAGFHVPQVIEISGEVVYIIAGTDDFGYAGDGGPARSAELDSPCGVAVAAAGFPIFIADTYNNVIRIMTADGINTFAGTGEAGFGGDGGPAREAMLYQPYRVRYHDPTGTLFICDTYNHRVRRVTADGVITTVAGNGEEGFSGDRGPADQARLALPYDARVGPDGAIYIADSANNRIRRVGEDGVITTVAGNGARGYSGDRGPALNAAFNNPSAVAFDEEGNLWIADTYNSAVRKVVRFFQTP